MLRCVIIDRHEATRRALQRRFGLNPRVEVVGAAATPRDGARVIDATRPDVAIVDVIVRPSGQLATLEELRAYDLHIPIIAFSARVTPQFVAEVLRAGARAFVAKDAPPRVLEHALHAVANGSCYLDPEIVILLLDATTSPSTSDERAALQHALNPIDAHLAEAERAAAARCLQHICSRLRESGMPQDVCGAIAGRISA